MNGQMAELKELSPEEKAKPYAKYYYMPPAAPDLELAEFLKDPRPMDPSKALAIEARNDLLNPGYLEGETGYCQMPNGTGHVAVNNKMPGVTADMVNWWFAWHGLEDLRYKLWWPRDHFAVSVSEEDRQKILDPNRPLVLKFQGITHHVVEDIGTGTDDLYISFMTPEDFGFDMSRWKAPNVATLVAANVIVKSPAGAANPRVTPVAMCHFVREIPGGVEFRTRFWMGYQIVDKKAKLMLPPGASVPLSVCQGLFKHCIEEYSNFKVFLPKIYQELEGRIP